MDRSFFRFPHLLLLFFWVAIYFALLLPTMDVHGISNDEFIDYHQISTVYQKAPQNWITGSDIDPTQARLPMYITALFCSFFDHHDHVTARYVSGLMGVLTLIGVYLFALKECNVRTAHLATGFLAVSPYFLAFSKVAMTEGDIFLACAGIWLMLAVALWIQKPDLGRTVLVAVMAGIATSTKVVVAVWVPALALPLLYLYQNKQPNSGNKHVLVLLMVVAVGLIALVTGYVYSEASHVAVLNRYYDRLPFAIKILHLLGVLIPWLLLLAMGVHKRHLMPHPLLCLVVVMAGSLLTFFVLPPVHTTNGSLLQGLYREFVSNTDRLSWMALYSGASFNILSLVIKNGLAVGLFVCVSVVAALFMLPRQKVLLVPLTLLFSYVFLLFVTARAQTFYMIGIMPLVAILAACLLDRIWERSAKVAKILVLIFLLNIGYDLKISYPDLHLNGYQWLGERYIAGRSSVGYKGIVQTPSDGTMQVIDWALANIPPDKRVVTYLRYRIMIAYLGPRAQLPFHVRDGLDPQWDISQADYVLLHINYLLDNNYERRTPQQTIYIYPFDREELEKDFEKVFSVQRAFGIEMASVWKRIDPAR